MCSSPSWSFVGTASQLHCRPTPENRRLFLTLHSFIPVIHYCMHLRANRALGQASTGNSGTEEASAFTKAFNRCSEVDTTTLLAYGAVVACTDLNLTATAIKFYEFLRLMSFLTLLPDKQPVR